MEDVASFEVACARDVVVLFDELSLFAGQDRIDFLGGPREEPAFLALALGIGTVGVGGGVEGASGDVMSRST